MKIAHVSDIHGHYTILDKVKDPPDLWCLTGDIFPYMKSSHHIHWGDPSFEIPHQMRWYSYKGGSIVRRLRGKPVLLVPGNHDFADLAMFLRRDGVDAREVTPEGVEFQGVRFAGFGHIPFIEGRWNREVHTPELRELTHRTLSVGNPEVLLTHAPPGNILGGDYPGNGPLLTALTYLPHQVRVHLFGHIHVTGGCVVEHMGIKFVNSATTVQVLEI
jgi:Icc-related predicted phosphoesterase